MHITSTYARCVFIYVIVCVQLLCASVGMGVCMMAYGMYVCIKLISVGMAARRCGNVMCYDM